MNILTKRGSQDNVVTYEHICDTIEDRQNIESKYITLGTVCIVLNGENGGMEVYMADSSKEWHDIMITGSDGESNASGLSIYVCAQNEVQNGKPAVSIPIEGTLYLVPSGNESGNLYDEYIYVNDAWEQFGSAGIDLTGYATQTWVQQQNYLTSHQDISGKANNADLATVATSGSYNDLSNKPTIPDIRINNSSIVNNGIANIPIANTNYLGAVRIYSTLGITTNENGALSIVPAQSSHIKAGSADYKVLNPTHQHEAVFYGLAKAAGDTTQSQSENAVGTYTDQAKTAIQNMLGISGDSPVESGTGTGSIQTKEFETWDVMHHQKATGVGAAAFGEDTMAIADSSFAEGRGTAVITECGHAEGCNTIAYGEAGAHAEGWGYTMEATITSIPSSSHYVITGATMSEVKQGQAVRYENNGEVDWSYIQEVDEENSTITVYGNAYPVNSTITIYQNTASGFASHTEGFNTIAKDYAHAEGEETSALGVSSHTEGYQTQAKADYSHAEGRATIASSAMQHVSGRGNIEDDNDGYAEIVGNGTYSNNTGWTRSNARTLDWNGNAWYAGKVTADGTPTNANDLTTKQYVDNAINGSTVSVSGTTPTITAVANTMYVCGEVSTLSFTPAVTGISDVIFESGSTATVLTVPNTVKFPDWFDATALEPNMVYEISIMNGTYGAVMAWATT